MRVLFTAQPAVSHLHPLVPLARELLGRGHDVAVASAPSFRTSLEAYGLSHVDAGIDWLVTDRSTWGSLPQPPPPGPGFARFAATLFADLTAAEMAKDLIEIGRTWRPDVMVRESLEFGGCIAAEVLGIPHASVACNALWALDSPTVTLFGGNRQLVAEPLARHRRRLGLPPDPEVVMPFRHVHLSFMPRRWDPPRLESPAHTKYLRHLDAVRPGAAVPGWLARRSGRRLVLASLGTVFRRTPGLLEAIVEGVAGEPVDLAVACGGDDRRRFARLPENVRLEGDLVQSLVLPHCDLLITHGGFNSVKEALGAGVPMVIAPITADQPYAAERCAALGVAEVVAPSERSPGGFGEAVRRVLGDGRYRAAARRFAGEMQALPGPGHAVALLEGMLTRAA